jgi:hypothetical protein
MSGANEPGGSAVGLGAIRTYIRSYSCSSAGHLMTMSRLCAFLFPALAAIALIAPAQAASSNAVVVQRQWSAMDKCAKEALQKFPDHTAEGLAQRDAYIRKCQRDARVPVREGLSPKE